jgi:uncharacterized protein (DUF362 family)
MSFSPDKILEHLPRGVLRDRLHLGRLVSAHRKQVQPADAAANGITRRRLAAGAGALLLGSCNTAPQQLAPVSIHRAGQYGEDLYDLVRRILTEHGVDVTGKRVVLKPNLVEFDENTVINTHPKLVHATLEAFRAAGAAEVKIAEGPGHRRVTLDLAESAGYFDMIPDFEKVFTDLNLDEVSEIPLRGGYSPLESLYLPNTVLDCDLLVSMPKLKAHHWVGATLSMKNFFGLVPGAIYGWPKNVLHWAGIEQCIADLHVAFPGGFAIVDGIVGMEGNGPIQGAAREVGVVVAGADRIAVDATCSRIMRFEPSRVPYLDLVAGAEQLREEFIPQIGESIVSVEQAFEVIPEMQYLRMG